MPLVYACVCPRSAALPRDDGRRSSRTEDALRRAAEELASYRPETLLLIGSRGAGQREKIGLVSAKELFARRGAAAWPVDAELVARIAEVAAEEAVPVTALRRWGGDLDEDCALLPLLGDVIEDCRLLLVAASRLAPRYHFEFGRAVGRAIDAYDRRVAIVCCAELSHRSAGAPTDRAGPAFDEHYRRAFEAWDVKWLVHADADLRRRAGEDAVAQTAVLMGALSGSRIQPRVLSYEAPFGAGWLVAAVDVLGPRRAPRAQVGARV